MELTDQIQRGPHAYYAESTGAQVASQEEVAWAAFAQGNIRAVEQMQIAEALGDKAKAAK